MKEYLFLYKEFNNRYYNLIDFETTSLRFLSDFFSDDYRPYDQQMFIRVVSCYNINFIYNDFKNNMFYIGFSEWELSDGEMHCPDDEEFPDYVNESNSCKIGIDNFIELAKKIMDMKKNPTPFAIMYRDDNDWIDFKGFDTQAEMESFIKNYQPEVVH